MLHQVHTISDIEERHEISYFNLDVVGCQSLMVVL